MLSISPASPTTDTVVIACPCQSWQLEVVVGDLRTSLEDEVREAMAEHLGECVVLAATSIAARAAGDDAQAD